MPTITDINILTESNSQEKDVQEEIIMQIPNSNDKACSSDIIQL